MKQTETPWDRDVRAIACTLVTHRLGSESAEIVSQALRMADAIQLLRNERQAQLRSLSQ